METGSAPQAQVATTEQAMGWITQGFELFKKAPGIWIGLTVVYLVVAIVASLIPYIGSVALTVVSPVITIGVMQGVRDQLAGNPLTIGHLFSGFSSPRMGALLLLGFLTMVGAVVIAIVGSVAAFGAAMGGAVGTADGLGLGVLLGLLIMLAAGLVLAMAVWFATPLVGFQGVEPIAAIKASFAACLGNFVPLLVWGLVALVLAVIGSIPLGLGLLVVGPILMAGYYLMYRDIFGDQ